MLRTYLEGVRGCWVEIQCEKQASETFLYFDVAETMDGGRTGIARWDGNFIDWEHRLLLSAHHWNQRSPEADDICAALAGGIEDTKRVQPAAHDGHAKHQSPA